MSEECTHDCSNCSAACSSRDAAPQHDAPNPNSSVKKVIGVVSGKGGVGKSMTSALLACAMARRGYHCGILDADITGPSIPKLFGIHGRAMADDKGCWPIQSRMGIDVMSINLLVENEEDPVVWRGPVIAGAVKQFWTDVGSTPGFFDRLKNTLTGVFSVWVFTFRRQGSLWSVSSMRRVCFL